MEVDVEVVPGTPPGTRVEVTWHHSGQVVTLSPAVAYDPAGNPIVAWPRVLEGYYLAEPGGRQFTTGALDADFGARAVQRTLQELWKVEEQIRSFLRIGLAREAAILHLFGKAEDQANLVKLQQKQSWESGALVGALGGLLVGSGAVAIAWVTRKK